MIKENIRIQIKLIILLCIFLSIPYRGYINKKVYDPEAYYQVLKKINRSSISTYDNIMIIYDKNNKADFYNLKKIVNKSPIFIKDFEKIIYLELYQKDINIKEKSYDSYVIINKDNKSLYNRGILVDEIIINDFEADIDEEIYNNTTLYQKKVNPFIPRFQNPKEFYNNFKEYFFPYYLGEYELK